MAEDTIKQLIGELPPDKGYDEAFAIVEFVRAAGDMLAQMRERAGLSQTALAQRLGMTPGRVWQLESGTLRNAPSLKSIARWARACGESLEITASGQRSARALEHAGDAGSASINTAVEDVTRVGKLVYVMPTDPSKVVQAGASPLAGAFKIAGVGTLEWHAIDMVASAASEALRAEGLAHVDVVARDAREVGETVELSLTLHREKMEQ